MDRLAYAEVDLDDAYQYKPFLLTKKDKPAPGYALLADLQTTLENNRANLSASANSVASANYEQAHVATSHNQLYHYQEVDDVHGNGGSFAATPKFNGVNGSVDSVANGQNLDELDTLLEDLNRSRFSGVVSAGGGVAAPPAPTADARPRPSVDALLNDLSTAVVQTAEVVGRHNAAAASSATEELDVLMASLSTFKGGANGDAEPIACPAPSTPDPTYAKPNKVQRAGTKDQLDSLLGNLQDDMNKQGVSATQKGCCSACSKPIVGQVITALGRTWHPECFSCAHCRHELGTVNFFERDGQPYCEGCYHNLFSPRCAYCNGPILDKCVTALGQTWHPDCFFCAQCGCQFGEDGFHEKDGKPYCKPCYLGMFALKCKACNMAITEGYISALNAQWHPQCFVCRDCNCPFQGGSFFVHEGMPYCETHYHAKRGSLCAACHKPITGRCITAMFRKFHPACFVCSYCQQQLKKGTFKEQGDKPYCHGCFERLFG